MIAATVEFSVADLFDELGVIEINRALTAGERFAARLGAEIRLAEAEGLSKTEVNEFLLGLVAAGAS